MRLALCWSRRSELPDLGCVEQAMIKQLEDYDFSERFATLNTQRHQIETGGRRYLWLAWLAASSEAQGKHLADTDLGSPARPRQGFGVSARLLCPGQQQLKGLAYDEGAEASDAAAMTLGMGDRRPPCSPVSLVHRPTLFVPPASSSLQAGLSQAGPPPLRSSSPGVELGQSRLRPYPSRQEDHIPNMSVKEPQRERRDSA